jgi:hypothetical protein
MTEKEREEEIYRRTEQRDSEMKRFEMMKKIKQADKARRREERKKAKKLAKKSSGGGASTGKNKSTENEMSFETTNKNDKSGAGDGSLNDSDLAASSSGVAVDSLLERRKTNESKRKDTDVSKALANLKADREKKKQQGLTLTLTDSTQTHFKDRN